MPSLVSLLQQLRDLVKQPGSASVAAVISTLDLDMSTATVKQMSNGDFVITKGRRQIFPFAPSIVVGISERKRFIFMLLEGPDRIAYTEDLMPGLSIEMVPSKYGAGFSVIAPIGAAKVGCTVSTVDHCIESIFGEVSAER